LLRFGNWVAILCRFGLFVTGFIVKKALLSFLKYNSGKDKIKELKKKKKFPFHNREERN